MAGLLVGVDIGTQGVKGVLFSGEGRSLASSFLPSNLYRPDSLTVEEDPEFQFESACRVIKSCISNSGVNKNDIAAVGFDGQMAGVIGLGRDGKHVTPYDSWLDMRCAPYIERMNSQAGDKILAKTGCAPSFNHGPKILRWKQEYRSIYKKIFSFVQPGSYMAMRLCGLNGVDAFIDSTYLHFSGFANNPDCCWDNDLCSEFSIDGTRLPRIVPPYTVVGEVIGDVARKCGLSVGTPVIAGCGDTAASFLACGAIREGVCVDVAGTASVFASTTTSFCPDQRNRVLACGRAAAPGLWHPYAYINGGGMNLEWFRKELARSKNVARKTGISFEELNQDAASLPLSEDAPLFIPHLGGRVCPSQPNLRGAWVDLNWSHTGAHLYRAALEGVALEYGIYRNILLELYPDLKLRELRITGGGEKSELWNQMKADILNAPVVQIKRSEGAPMGAALLAGYGVGLYKDLSKAATLWVEKGDSHSPKKSNRKYYRDRLIKYQALLTILSEYGDRFRLDESS